MNRRIVCNSINLIHTVSFYAFLMENAKHHVAFKSQGAFLSFL